MFRCGGGIVLVTLSVFLSAPVRGAALEGSVPGATAVTILDVTGRTMARDLPVVGDGFFRWDGRMVSASFAPAGRYLPVASGTLGMQEMAGIDWIRCQADPAFDLGNEGCFDAGGIYMPSTWSDGDTLKLCYAGFSGEEGGIYRIGLAWSVDGGATWNRSCDPVLSEGAPGQFDDTGVLAPQVFEEPSGALVMHYAGFTGGPFDGRYAVGRAESTDGGHTWEKETENPIFDGETNWSEMSLFTSVIATGSGYTMWFVGLDFSHGEQPWKIGRATSLNGIYWSVSPADPVYEGSEPWELFGTPSLDVVSYGGEFVMWTGGTDGEVLSIGRATSMDGIDWSPDQDNPLATPEPGAWDGTDITEPSATHASSGLTLFHAGSDADWTWRVGCKLDPIQEVSGDLPAGIGARAPRIHAPSPNPFNPWTLIAFELNEPGSVNLTIFDSTGRRVRVLSDGAYPTGRSQVAWDGRNDLSEPVVSGAYTAVLTTATGQVRTRLILLR